MPALVAWISGCVWAEHVAALFSPATASWREQGCLFTCLCLSLSLQSWSELLCLCLLSLCLPPFADLCGCRCLAVIAAFPRLGSVGCKKLLLTHPVSHSSFWEPGMFWQQGLKALLQNFAPRLCGDGCNPPWGFSFPFGHHPKRGKSPNQGRC